MRVLGGTGALDMHVCVWSGKHAVRAFIKSKPRVLSPTLIDDNGDVLRRKGVLSSAQS